MAILEAKVWVSFRGDTSVNHYENLGYEIPRYTDSRGKIRVKRGTGILVKIEHLTEGSQVRVTKICDMPECGKYLPNIRFVDIINKRKNGDGKDRCMECAAILRGRNQKNNINYEQTLEFCAKRDNKEYLLKEFSDKNIRNPNLIAYQSNEVFIWNCLKCNSEYPMKMNNRTSINNNGCPYCSGQKVNRTNSIYTLRPDVADLLTNSEDAHKYTPGSGKKVNFTCPDCKNTDTKAINNVTQHGFACSKCGDGLSFPEKFMTNLLWQLKLDFKSQKYFNWSSNKRYDFFIGTLNCLIEVHGAQHYKESFAQMGGRTLEEEQENDILKEKLAKENGINNYIIINCSESNTFFIKNNIIKSELSNMFDLSNINWNKCYEYASNSLVKTVCDLYKNKPMSTMELGKLVGLEKSTICRYLKLGAKIGWCSYDARKAKMKQVKAMAGMNAIKVIQLSLDGEFIKEWNSAHEIEKELGIYHSNISKVCKGKELNQTGGFRFMFKEDYEKNGVSPSKDVRPRVIKLSLSGEFIKEYRNANVAIKELGKVKTAVASIKQCCAGERISAYGCKWMYKEDYDLLLKTN